MRYSFSVTRRQHARIPLVLRSVGIDHDQDPILRPKGFPIWQIFLGVSGEGEFYADGARFVLRPGQIAILPPHASHGYRSTGGTWLLHYVGFEGLLCQRMMAVLGLGEAGVYEPADASGLLAHLHTLEQLATAPDADPVRRSSALYALLLDLSAGLRRLPDSRAAESDGLEKEMILYLEDHYAEDISLDTLAARFRRTPEYLCGIFKAATGETISHYLRHIRVHRAKVLLMERPDASLREICEACGFHSLSYFGKVFREATGFTPQGYRLGTPLEEPGKF